MLELVNAVETCQLSEHVEVPTSQIRKYLKSYQRAAHLYPAIAAEDVREHIVEWTAEVEVLTTAAECDKL